MPRDLKTLQRFATCGLLTFSCFCFGCGTAEQGSEAQIMPVAPQAKQIVEGTWNSELTAAEIQHFLSIVEELPGSRVPEFKRADLTLQQTPGESIESYINKVRGSLNTAIDPQRQAQHWRKNPRLQQAFAEQGIAPEDFATLATKISFSWSAAAVQGEVPTLLAQRQIREQLERFKQIGSQDQADGNLSQGAESLQLVRELLALGQFLEFVTQIPESNLQVIEQHHEDLKRVLPEVEMASQINTFLQEATSVASQERTIK